MGGGGGGGRRAISPGRGKGGAAKGTRQSGDNKSQIAKYLHKERKRILYVGAFGKWDMVLRPARGR